MNHNCILKSDYIELCKKYELDEKKALHISQYYHDLGVFLHFQENPILDEIIFLKPNWATGAVYKLLDDELVTEQYGKFSLDDIKRVWKEYPTETHIKLVELMRKFELCFKVPNKNFYVIPELLSSQKPNLVKWNYSNNLTIEYQYKFMPAGILTRFIVICHHMINNNLFWKDGAILSYEGAEALVISDLLNRKLKIYVSGNNRLQLLSIVREKISYIHTSLNNPPFEEFIPCNCNSCKRSKTPFYFDYKLLKKCLDNDIQEILCEKTLKYINVSNLLGDFEEAGNKNLNNTSDSKEKEFDVFSFDKLKSTYFGMKKKLEAYNELARKKVNRGLLGIGLFILVLTLITYQVITNTDWNILEPYTFLISGIPSILIYFYFAINKSSFSLGKMYEKQLSEQKYKICTNKEFDLVLFEEIELQYKKLKAKHLVEIIEHENRNLI